jgi:hypothetical protein
VLTRAFNNFPPAKPLITHRTFIINLRVRKHQINQTKGNQLYITALRNPYASTSEHSLEFPIFPSGQTFLYTWNIYHKSLQTATCKSDKRNQLCITALTNFYAVTSEHSLEVPIFPFGQTSLYTWNIYHKSSCRETRKTRRKENPRQRKHVNAPAHESDTWKLKCLIKLYITSLTQLYAFPSGFSLALSILLSD